MYDSYQQYIREMGWCIGVLVAVVCYMQINRYVTQAAVISKTYDTFDMRIPISEFENSQSFQIPTVYNLNGLQQSRCKKCHKHAPQMVSISMPAGPNKIRPKIIFDMTGTAILCQKGDQNATVDVTVKVKDDNGNWGGNMSAPPDTNTTSKLTMDNNGTINAESFSNSFSNGSNTSLDISVSLSENNKPAGDSIITDSTIQNNNDVISSSRSVVNDLPSNNNLSNNINGSKPIDSTTTETSPPTTESGPTAVNTSNGAIAGSASSTTAGNNSSSADSGASSAGSSVPSADSSPPSADNGAPTNDSSTGADTPSASSNSITGDTSAPTNATGADTLTSDSSSGPPSTTSTGGGSTAESGSSSSTTKDTSNGTSAESASGSSSSGDTSSSGSSSAGTTSNGASEGSANSS